jgi:hypothetical protein
MRGAWLTAIASRILSDQTFHWIAAPAIADLQFEGRRRHYAAVLWAILYALLHDIRLEITTVFGSTARASIWRKPLALFALLFVVMTVTSLTRGIWLRSPDGAVSRVPWPRLGDGLEPILAGIVVSVGLSAAGYATLGLMFALRRREAPIRAVVIGALCISALAFAAARASRPVAITADLYRSAAAARAGVGVSPSRPLSDIVADDIRWRRTALAAGSESSQRFAVWQERRIALNVLVFALLGVTIARGRGLGILFRAIGILGTADTLRDAMPWLNVLFWSVNSRPPSVTLEQLPAFLILPLVTVAVLTFDVWVTSRRRDSPRAARA